ncbi:MAG TPA: phosphatase PAP2 family protein [Patescibacteria group bacterium]|nr:phosphatase PAP2 family protein [Patescibacteria group bacterium]
MAVFYILIVAIGKIYLGQHWLSDTIGGFLLGAGMGFIPVAFFLH